MTAQPMSFQRNVWNVCIYLLIFNLITALFISTFTSDQVCPILFSIYIHASSLRLSSSVDVGDQDIHHSIQHSHSNRPHALKGGGLHTTGKENGIAIIKKNIYRSKRCSRYPVLNYFREDFLGMKDECLFLFMNCLCNDSGWTHKQSKKPLWMDYLFCKHESAGWVEPPANHQRYKVFLHWGEKRKRICSRFWCRCNFPPSLPFRAAWTPTLISWEWRTVVHLFFFVTFSCNLTHFCDLHLKMGRSQYLL